jgi:hypothetical protein
MHNYGYGYANYDPYSLAGSPFPTMGNGDQVYGPQHYQYPPNFQKLDPTSRPYTPSKVALHQEEVSTSTAADLKPLPVKASNGNSNVSSCGGQTGKKGSSFLKPTYENSFLPGSTYAYGYQDRRSAFDGARSPVSWFDVPVFSDEKPRLVTGSKITSISNANNFSSSKNQNFHPNSHFMVSKIPHYHLQLGFLFLHVEWFENVICSLH